MTINKERFTGAIHRLTAQFLTEEANHFPLITVTRCEISSDSKRAVVFVTILPEDKEEQTLSFLRRKRTDIRKYIQKNNSRCIPTIDILIDGGEKNRQRIDELTR